MADSVSAIVAEVTRRHTDLRFAHVDTWKREHRGRAIGCLPAFAPREILWASGCLPVFVRGAGDQLETVRGDAFYQSYICHLPRSVLELGLGGWLDVLDGMVFPNTCDVIRNLSGVWQGVFPRKLTRFLDPPQSTGPAAVRWWRGELDRLHRDLCALSGRSATAAAVQAAIDELAASRLALKKLGRARAETPWLYPADEVYLLRRAGDAMPPGEHVDLVRRYLQAGEHRAVRREDRIRVVLAGAFCEQPPVAMLRAVERAGCYVVADDLLLGLEDLDTEVPRSGDPVQALAQAYVDGGTQAPVRFDAHRTAGQKLVQLVKDLRADGVVFGAPSFCDPALLEQPRLGTALDEAAIPWTAFKYAENTGQFQSIREQAGTFADSVRLWGGAA